MQEKKKVVAILSGGMDSTVTAYKTKQVHKLVGAISFDYGQKHVKELDCAKETAKKLGVPHKIIDLKILSPLLQSALTKKNITVPKGHYEDENMKQTVVPNRNMIMASISAGWAITLKADAISLGVHQGDHTVYPDCRIEFIEALKGVLNLCDYRKIDVYTPFLSTDKIGIVKEGFMLGVPFEDTWTCYVGGKKPCGQCGSCVERSMAFMKNNLIDPLFSIKNWEKQKKHVKSLIGAF